MRKTILLLFAGLGSILAGCNSGTHRFQTIPVDDPGAGQYPAVAPQPERRQPVVAPLDTELKPAPVRPVDPVPVKTEVRKYEPMTGAVSSGGVDKVPGQKRTVKKTSRVVKKNNTVKAVGDGKATVHVIKRGEYPGLIAKRYGVSTNALLQANGLTLESAKKLQVGHKLNIPARTAAVSKESAVKKNAAMKDPGPGKHRIKQGETPDVIARRYKVNLDELMAANNLTEEKARRLQVNQILIIPGRGGATITIKDADKEKKNETTVVAQDEVKKNDSATTDATSGNNQPKTDEISEEDILLLDTTMLDITEDTTYAKVAADYGVSEKTLRALNGGAADDKIAKGTMLTVPKK